MSSKNPCLHNKGDTIQPMHNFSVAVVNCKLQLQLQFTTATVKLCRDGIISILLSILEAQRYITP
jgi:hypothetical protein